MGNCSVNCCAKEEAIKQVQHIAEIHSVISEADLATERDKPPIVDKKGSEKGYSDDKENAQMLIRTETVNKQTSMKISDDKHVQQPNRMSFFTQIMIVVDKLDRVLIEETFGNKRRLHPIRFENGSVYDGEWLNGQRWGSGKQRWSDGTEYEGDWAENKAYGNGILRHHDGDVYEGEWKFDKANGFGKYTHRNGATYEGEWRDDKQEGKGVERWPDGSHYEGEYHEGRKHGKGKIIFADGSYYSGEFDSNNIHGQGIYVEISKYPRFGLTGKVMMVTGISTKCTVQD